MAAFGAALRDGRPLEAFGLEHAPWLRRLLCRGGSSSERDKAIAELGKMLPPFGVEGGLAKAIAAPSPLPDPAQEAVRKEIIAAQAVIYPMRSMPVSRHTIRRARARYGGTVAR